MNDNVITLLVPQEIRNINHYYSELKKTKKNMYNIVFKQKFWNRKHSTFFNTWIPYL